MTSALIIALYYQTKTPISFWCRRGLNPKFLIQPSEILPVELIETHLFSLLLIAFVLFIYFFDIILSYFGSEILNLYQNTILTMYLNISINY